jgi:ribonucleotide reductase alpha subunit
LDEWQKDIFKTSMEIDQRWIVEHAADRQEYIDQAQSLNLFFRPDCHIAYLHAAHFLAWKKGLKTLYYCRSEKLAKADKVSKKIERQIIQELDMNNNQRVSCLDVKDLPICDDPSQGSRGLPRCVNECTNVSNPFHNKNCVIVSNTKECVDAINKIESDNDFAKQLSLGIIDIKVSGNLNTIPPSNF